MSQSTYEIVRALAQEDPDWIPVVRACVEFEQELGNQFAGSWIVYRLGTWVPNLKPLVSKRILEKTLTTRGGRRAYYRLLDPEGARRALVELHAL